MRVFVAIKLSDQLISKIQQWRINYSDLPVRWNSDEGLHVTLVPPWEIEGSDLYGLIEKLGQLSIKKFDLLFDRIKMPVTDIIKSNRESDMIWLYGPISKPFVGLKDQLEKLLNLEFVHTRFQNHVTLARFERRHLSASRIKSIEQHMKWHQLVDSIVLFQSHLQSDGAKYKILATIPLQSE